ncbi:hypothetical protein HY311_01260 [Candidatus Nomurabacteria bacterium]|nr:hypothetical protein [Candidatus Nomurabacteria bacterium]
MEPNNNKKSLVSVLIVIGVIVLAIMGWMILQKNKAPTSTPAEEVTKEAGVVLLQSKFIFPKTLGLTRVTQKQVPVSIQIFSLAATENQTYNSIQYESGKTGYQSLYVVSNLTTQEYVRELAKQLATPGTKSSWVLQGSASTHLAGYVEFLDSVSAAQARVTFFQQGSGVKVTVQSLNTK